MKEKGGKRGERYCKVKVMEVNKWTLHRWLQNDGMHATRMLISSLSNFS